MQSALDNADAVFTHHLDFGSMLALGGTSGPRGLQERCLNVLPEAIGPLVLSLLSTYGSELEKVGLELADARRERERILSLSTA